MGIFLEALKAGVASALDVFDLAAGREPLFYLPTSPKNADVSIRFTIVPGDTTRYANWSFYTWNKNRGRNGEDR